MVQGETDDRAEPGLVFAEPGRRHGPADQRLREVRDYNTVYSVPAFDTLAAWQRRAAELRRHILVSAGLWPLPERCPLRPVFSGRLERDGYSVEKVYFESLPGFFVTGNVYRPLGQSGPRPAILNPHGHSQRGRLTHNEVFSTPARCITFARQGYVAFTYDMIGYLDSKQLSHRFGGPAEHLWGLSLAGLQLWNSLRAVDFLCALPDVDPARIGCTGESGGGTQTFLLTAVDERIAVAAPVNMVSAHMQGGCLCENPPLLRVETTNVELAALAAPRPLLLVSATGDWTRNTLRIEFPAIHAIYQLFGAGERAATVQIDAGHNYNQASREQVYPFFARWLAGEPGEPVSEPSVTVEPDDDLRVFPGAIPPPGELTAATLTCEWTGEARATLARDLPRDAAGLAHFREVYGVALRQLLMPAALGPATTETMATEARHDCQVERLLLGRAGGGEQIPALFFMPPDWAGARAAVVAHAGGKAALIGPDSEPGALLAGLLAGGWAVLAPDLFLTGEYHQPWGQAGRDQSALYFTTYNWTDTALRVQDLLTTLAVLRERAPAAALALIGRGEAGLWSLLARALLDEPLRVAADTAGFDRTSDRDYLDRLYVPGLRRAGDFLTALTLAAPAPLLLDRTRANFVPAEVAALYRSLGAASALRAIEAEADAAMILDWLAD
jgi:dienelactone hydrolase